MSAEQWLDTEARAMRDAVAYHIRRAIPAATVSVYDRQETGVGAVGEVLVILPGALGETCVWSIRDACPPVWCGEPHAESEALDAAVRAADALRHLDPDRVYCADEHGRVESYPLDAKRLPHLPVEIVAEVGSGYLDAEGIVWGMSPFASGPIWLQKGRRQILRMAVRACSTGAT